jgi:hypothetical protein
MVNKEEPFQIKYAGTGFMLIKREVFETLKPHSAIYTNGGHTISEEEEVYDFFPVGVTDGKLLSEDFNFCNLYSKHGGTIWAAPWCELGHFGSYLFTGQYSQGA